MTLRVANISLLLMLTALSIPDCARSASLRLLESAPQRFDFIDIPSLPSDFGRAEFAFELWIKPDASFPVGPVWRASKDQLRNWSDADPEPLSSTGWWLAGNFLLDGHTRPHGFDFDDTREGTFSLQFYGGGRLRWMFADGDLDVPGKVWSVQAWPASTAPSLLDDRWHHIVAQRRWRNPKGAVLELWIDGQLQASREIPQQVDMRQWWDTLAHPGDPSALGGWALGAEVMTAWDQVFNQYEDYKGQVDELRLWSRSLDSAEIIAAARGEPVVSDAVLAHFSFDENAGDIISDLIDPDYRLTLHRGLARSWVSEDAPACCIPTSSTRPPAVVRPLPAPKQ